MKVVHPTGVRVATLTGHILLLEAEVVTELPPSLVPLAIANGAHLADNDDESVAIAAPVAPGTPIPTVDVPHTPAPATPQSREDKLVAILQDIAGRAQKEEFRNDGSPKAALVNRIFGDVVTEEERMAAWAKVMKKV